MNENINQNHNEIEENQDIENEQLSSPTTATITSTANSSPVSMPISTFASTSASTSASTFASISASTFASTSASTATVSTIPTSISHSLETEINKEKEIASQDIFVSTKRKNPITPLMTVIPVKKSQSWVWEYVDKEKRTCMVLIKDRNGEQIQCNWTCKGTTSTSSVLGHLRSVHRIIPEQIIEKNFNQNEQNNEQISLTKFEIEIITNHLLAWIIDDMQAFS
ncbi:17954_t:CDS:1, partial [Acaulospora morrowiae]